MGEEAAAEEGYHHKDQLVLFLPGAALKRQCNPVHSTACRLSYPRARRQQRRRRGARHGGTWSAKISVRFVYSHPSRSGMTSQVQLEAAAKYLSRAGLKRRRVGGMDGAAPSLSRGRRQSSPLSSCLLSPLISLPPVSIPLHSILHCLLSHLSSLRSPRLISLAPSLHSTLLRTRSGRRYTRRSLRPIGTSRSCRPSSASPEKTRELL